MPIQAGRTGTAKVAKAAGRPIGRGKRTRKGRA